MSNELIKITTNEEGIQLVSARELHKGLEVKSRFADWIKNRINKYSFEENEDYTIISEPSKNLEGSRLVNREQTDYIITLDMAKELCMVENNELGRQFRKYFIECEKKLKQLNVPSYMIDDPIKRAERWIIEEKQRQALAEKVEELKPKADYTDNVLASDGLLSISQIAKEFGMTGRKLNELLNKLGVQYKQGRIWVLYAKYDDEGYTKYVTHLVQGAGSVTYSKWTQAGRKFIYEILAENNIHPIC